VVLVDTSVWVDALRQAGPPALREELGALIEKGEAAWCPAVRLELWTGIRDQRERRVLRQFSSVLLDLPITGEVWEQAIVLAEKGRRKGQTFPYPDLIIFACSRWHAAELLHRDSHFDILAKIT
jgi:predicted nucleic acid-binding protein